MMKEQGDIESGYEKIQDGDESSEEKEELREDFFFGIRWLLFCNILTLIVLFVLDWTNEVIVLKYVIAEKDSLIRYQHEQILTLRGLLKEGEACMGYYLTTLHP
jgi:hypothetical protein